MREGIALAVVFSFMYAALAWIAIGRRAHGYRRLIANMESHVDLPYEPEPEEESEIVLPPERRTRTRYAPHVTIDWDAAGPDERAAAALAVLPTHYEDSNGITATDVAHRLGVHNANRVAPALRSLVKSGQAHQHWDKASRRRRVYWRTSS